MNDADKARPSVAKNIKIVAKTVTVGDNAVTDSQCTSTKHIGEAKQKKSNIAALDFLNDFGMIRPVRTKINDDEMIYEVVHTGKFSTHGTRIYIYMPMAKQN